MPCYTYYSDSGELVRKLLHSGIPGFIITWKYYIRGKRKTSFQCTALNKYVLQVDITWYIWCQPCHVYLINLGGPSWSWSYGSWIYNYLFNQWSCEFESRSCVLDTTLSLSVTCGRSVVFSRYSGFLHQ